MTDYSSCTSWPFKEAQKLLKRYREKPGAPVRFRAGGRWMLASAPCNGWDHWYYLDDSTGERKVIDCLRQIGRDELKENGWKVKE